MKIVLTIAGYDPSSGAGVTADLMVFAAHRLFGMSCITALTVQSTLGVREVHPIPAAVVANTLACLQEDTPPAGIKIGMLATAANVGAVCDYLEGVRSAGEWVPVVLDPVIRSSSGAALLDGRGTEAVGDRLLGLVDWVTPNTAELGALSGREIRQPSEIPEICRRVQDRVHARFGRTVGIVAKGGHLEKPDDYVLSGNGQGLWLPGERVDTRSTHGTGCALSSAFLSRLVLRHEGIDAAKTAKEYVTRALRTATPIGLGSGPMNHLWPILEVEDEP